MSAFLGPIHYWLYRKIQLQDLLVNSFVNFGKANLSVDLSEEINQTYGVLSQEPLEAIIDESNIHGWLQERVSLVELRLAAVVTHLLQTNPECKADLITIASKFGANLPTLVGSPMQVQNKVPTSPKECYEVINNTLLDGMPCDRATSLTQEDETQVEWVRNACVHQEYWNYVNGDIANYYEIRDAIISGILTHTPFQYQMTSSQPATYRIA